MGYEDKYDRENNNNKALKGGDTESRDSSTQHSDAIQAIPLEVKVYGNNFDRALKAFRALVQKERILSAYKDKQTYEKPSDRRRRKRNEASRKRLEGDYKERYPKPAKEKASNPDIAQE